MISLQHLKRLLALLPAFAATPLLAAGPDALPPAMCMTVTTTTTNSACNAATGTATANVVGGVAPYTYLWSNGQTTQTATGLGTLVHSVTVTDAFGCIQVATADVDNGGPNINVLTVNNPTCAGLTNGSASVTWTGGTGFVFAGWRIPNLVAPATSVTNLAPGTYSVGVGDGTGCADSMLFTVTAPLPLTNSFATIHTSCGLNNGTLTATGSGGTGTIGYAWSNSQSGATASGLAPGAYTVTLTDANGCTANFSTSVNASTAPTLSLSSSTGVSCFGGNNGSATVAAASGSPGYSYQWPASAGSQTGPTATSLSAGTYTVTVTDAATCTATLPVTISTPTALSGTMSTVAVGCNVGSPNGSATANPSGGTGPYTYLWNTSPAQTTQTATNLPVGPYSVTITDFNGCTVTATGNVGATTTPAVNASTPQTICAGQSAAINALASGGAPGYTFAWSCPNLPCAIDTVSDDDPTVTPTTTTMYHVTVTDQNGCTSTDSVLITVMPLPVANAGPNFSICVGDTVQLQGSASGAGPVYDFLWTPATNLSSTTIADPLAFPNFTTIYTLNVSSNGCAGTPDQVTVTVNPVPSINAGPDITACYGNQATLTAVSAGANPVTYTWAANGNPFSIAGPPSVNVTPTATTTYTVVAVSGANCASSIDTVLVTVIPYPQANAGPDFQLCAGDTATLLGSYFFLPGDTLINTAGLTYSWNPPLGLSSTSVAQPQAFPGTSTTYTLTVSYQGCQSQNTVQVDVFPLPTAVATASDTLICSGDSIQLLSIGSIGTSIVWTPVAPLVNPSAPNPIAFPADSMWFTVTVTNGSCSAQDSVFINVPTNPDAYFAASDTIVCLRDLITFTDSSTGALDLLWNVSDGRVDSTDGSVSFSFFTEGQFTVSLTATGEGNCTDVHSLVLTVLEGPIAQYSTEPPYDQAQTFPAPDFTFFEEATDETEWIWRFPNDSIIEAPQAEHVFLSPGGHIVELLVIDAEGCRDSVRHTIVILPPDVQEYNVFSPNGDGVNDVFFADYAGNREFIFTIFDRWGNQLFQSTSSLTGWDGRTRSGAMVPEGVYYYTLWVGPDHHSAGNVTLLR